MDVFPCELVITFAQFILCILIIRFLNVLILNKNVRGWARSGISKAFAFVPYYSHTYKITSCEHTLKDVI